MKNEKIKNEPMPSGSVRLREDQWTFVKERCKEFGAENANEFIRDAIDFYTEWLTLNNTQKFLTPALESVITAKSVTARNACLGSYSILPSRKICWRISQATIITGTNRR